MPAKAGERREVTVSAQRRGGDTLAICVSDAGSGLAPEVAERVFDPFVTTRPGSAARFRPRRPGLRKASHPRRFSRDVGGRRNHTRYR
ncbi:sensory histidine kinase AtoS [compost metagenome]